MTACAIASTAELTHSTGPSRMRDHPIVLTTRKFVEVTGYSSDEIVSRNCRFLQGPSTSLEAVERIRSALNNGQGCCELLLSE